MNTYEQLRIENQLCFPLYAAAKEVVRLYTPHLAPLGLTYTQYIAMMVLWQEKSLSIKALGQRLYLDTGTLTPLLKKLEGKGYLVRRRDEADERSVLVTVTQQGMDLREAVAEVPARVGACIPLPPAQAQALHAMLHGILDRLKPGVAKPDEANDTDTSAIGRGGENG